MNNNTTSSLQEWVQTTCSTYKPTENISRSIPDIELATGFILDGNQPVVVDGVTLNVDNFFMENVNQASELIKQMVSAKHQIYVHAAIKTTEKDYSKITDQEKQITIQAQQLKSQGDIIGSEELQEKWTEILKNLPNKERILFTAAIKPA